ncbi:hypothetical protein A2715_04715 [Candidatus Woesebacteria bacterium RIFCSPHIGHO2_01_FULL_39_32]|uniref:Glycosyltransferase 2-like domain-containing protein n=1 Tax=Candidatus Woesebacteria bacterium RIFCSPLOWO2_01_FULL_39_25 TaxID=1802521 RepID=A0A1F8BL95_9BACT|nr:MAG: hypothetical protein A2124_03250 [Candidatus Woesebacteria bacterium GWB1_37_5]OGM25320.1 MAG: hypothetical protein A2715_04715 [Candidatus Woesebacteria bacterium RIFCSPHIGHO2_01_FULL_39_32]OGM37819.1 MAG: hypothetical protein A3F01_01925 [Candidatus Woesebacteria bacterium RIFCSPHIGHO2_12_FULL_38_11]OGM64851.1 MAG: hypothetical protein A2893_04325 [Candidatus Woesebacteria bacterium RIFCSPLOWO2_01_FULL_39_25]
MVDVSVIIVSFNTKVLTLQCIKSIIDSIERLDYEIIVIDNGSSDGTVEGISKIKNQKSNIQIKIIKNEESIGFAKANNQGIKKANGKYIFLLNSDTMVRKGVIEKLIDFVEGTPDAGVVGPKLLNPDGSIQPSAFNLPTIERAIKQYWFGKNGLLDKYAPFGHEPRSVESLVMAAYLITPKALEEIGFLDERYFMYFEDFDYCKRVKDVGLKVYYFPTAEVIHYHGASGKNIADEKNQWRRLIPSSKIYHGTVKHYLFNFILWSGQKWEKYFH